MHELIIQLQDNYKSFNRGFVLDLKGNLVIISGVNGSGKSQLMDSIKGNYPNDPSRGISALRTLDNSPLDTKDILYRSFRDNILQVSNIGSANPQNLINQKNNVYNYYMNGSMLNHESANLRGYKKASKKAKTILIDRFGESIFNSGALTSQQIQATIPNDFIWEPDDIFTNLVADTFFIYANKVATLITDRYNEGRGGEIINFEAELGVAPWKELNSLFELLNIGYRFKDNYVINGSFLNEQPKLYAFDNGTMDITHPREVDELSDGEKVIVGLIFSSLNTNNEEDGIKILLLDEFDATLNPSLTKMFFEVIKRYFIDQNIMVIIVTHSPTTMSLAPEYTSFYEVFKKSASTRIISVQRSEYQELQIAHKDFYDQLADQESRIAQLNTSNVELTEILSNRSKPLLFVEGPTDKTIIEIAWNKLYPSEPMPFYIPEIRAGHNAKDVKFEIEKAETFQNNTVIGIFDFDTEGYNQWNGLPSNYQTINDSGETCLLKKDVVNNFYGILLPLNNTNLPNTQLFKTDGKHFGEKSSYPIELMFYGYDNSIDSEYFHEEELPGGKIITFKNSGKKIEFSNKLRDLHISYFENFRTIFEKLQEISV